MVDKGEPAIVPSGGLDGPEEQIYDPNFPKGHPDSYVPSSADLDISAALAELYNGGPFGDDNLSLPN